MLKNEARSISKAVQRLGRRDPTLKWIYLSDKQLTDAKLGKLADCLLAHPDVVAHVFLDRNRLTDETGIKMARYLAVSSTIQILSLDDNQLGSATYLAMAAALRVNSSLQILFLFDNQAVDRTRIDAAFVEALRLNPVRPTGSLWCLYTATSEFGRLKCAADILGPLSMLSQLRHCDRT